MLIFQFSASSFDENKYDLTSSTAFDWTTEDIADEWDLAMRHNRNKKLGQKEKVKEFFAKVKTIKSIWDLATRDWIGFLSLYMRGEAIPLFENSDEESVEDYQLSLCPS